MIDFDDMLNDKLNTTDPVQAWYWLIESPDNKELRKAFDRDIEEVENSVELNMTNDFNFFSACYCKSFVEFLHAKGEI